MECPQWEDKGQEQHCEERGVSRCHGMAKIVGFLEWAHSRRPHRIVHVNMLSSKTARLERFKVWVQPDRPWDWKEGCWKRMEFPGVGGGSG